MWTIKFNRFVKAGLPSCREHYVARVRGTRDTGRSSAIHDKGHHGSYPLINCYPMIKT